MHFLAFGVDPDFALVRDLAIQSGAFARRIYETSDAAIQLEDFHSRISSPLLYDVKFEYVGASFTEKTRLDVSKTFYKGGEYIVAGKIKEISNLEEEIQPEIIIQASQYIPQKYESKILPCYLRNESNINVAESEALLADESILKRPSLCIPINKPTIVRSDAENFIERLWAFLTIQNLLDDANKDESSSIFIEEITTKSSIEKDIVSNTTENIEIEKSDRDRALDIALKYNFVTDVTSLVVRKPNEDKNETVSMIESESQEDKDTVLPQLTNSKSKKGYSTSYVNQKQVNYGYSQKVIPKGAIQNSFKLRGAPSPQFASASNYGPLSAPFNVGGQAPRRRQRPSISVRKRPVLNSIGISLTTSAYPTTNSYTTTTTGIYATVR